MICLMDGMDGIADNWYCTSRLSQSIEYSYDFHFLRQHIDICFLLYVLRMITNNFVSGLAADLPDQVKTELAAIYRSAGELLRHFWTCFPVSTPALEEKLSKTQDTLRKFHQLKIQHFEVSCANDIVSRASSFEPCQRPRQWICGRNGLDWNIRAGLERQWLAFAWNCMDLAVGQELRD